MGKQGKVINASVVKAAEPGFTEFCQALTPKLPPLDGWLENGYGISVRSEYNELEESLHIALFRIGHGDDILLSRVQIPGRSLQGAPEIPWFSEVVTKFTEALEGYRSQYWTAPAFSNYLKFMEDAEAIPCYTQDIYNWLYHDRSDTMSFSGQDFLDANFSESNATKRTLVPEGWYLATILDEVDGDADYKRISAKSGSGPMKKDPDRTWYWMMMKVPFRMSAPDNPAVDERIVSASIFMDVLQEDNDRVLAGVAQVGAPDFGTDKNINLGQLREAIGQNAAGVSWNPHMMGGQQLLVYVSHQPNKSKPGEEFATVTGYREYTGELPQAATG